MNTCVKTLKLRTLILAGFLCQPAIDAATITITQVSEVISSTLDADLTALGADDWVIWDGWTGFTADEYDSKSGGSGIGALTYSGGNADVEESTAGMQFDYTDGTNFAGTQTDINEGTGRRISDVGGSPDGALSLSITLPNAETEIDLFLSSTQRTLSTTLFAEIGSDTASTSFGFSNYNNHYWHYRIDVSGANPSDVITIDWEGDGGDFNSRLIMNAATVTAIPEPSTFALVGLAIGSILLFRRRK